MPVLSIAARSGSPFARAMEKRWQDMDGLPTSSTQQSAVAILFSMTALAFVTCASRMYVRFSMKSVGLDHWLMCAAMTFSIALSVPTYMFFRYEYIGFVTVDVPESYDPEPVLFWNWMMQVLYNPILALVKSSILVFLLRLGSHRRSIRYSIYALNTFNLCQMVTIFITVLVQTVPVHAYWNLDVERTNQIYGVTFYIVTAIITIITDFLVLFIPLWIFAGLKMRIVPKIALMLVFMMGAGVTVVGIIRVHELRKKFYNLDPNYDSRNGVGDTYSTIEVNLAIIAACGPTLRPLFRKMVGDVFSSKSSNDNGASGYPNSSTMYARGSTARRSITTSFPFEEMGKAHTEIRDHSLNGSEDEIMTYNGIMRTTAVHVNYEEPDSPDSEKKRGNESRVD